MFCMVVCLSSLIFRFPRIPTCDTKYETTAVSGCPFCLFPTNDFVSKDTYDWFVAPTDEDQAFFNSWDFVSMHTLKIELGISSEMAAHDQSFKVRSSTVCGTCLLCHAIVYTDTILISRTYFGNTISQLAKAVRTSTPTGSTETYCRDALSAWCPSIERLYVSEQQLCTV